jgi:hypothetical protein
MIIDRVYAGFQENLPREKVNEHDKNIQAIGQLQQILHKSLTTLSEEKHRPEEVTIQPAE